MKQDFTEILQKNKLKITGPRKNVLAIISSRKVATSQPVLEKMVGKEVDRVTLYRILKTFEEKGILHKVIDLHGTANYALCSSSCSAHEHHDEHFHFNCTNCNMLYCMNDFKMPPIQMPHGFKAETINLLISGTCENCNTQPAQVN
jgi:Fur family ferric uptake transcriptional regulator